MKIVTNKSKTNIQKVINLQIIIYFVNNKFIFISMAKKIYYKYRKENYFIIN